MSLTSRVSCAFVMIFPSRILGMISNVFVWLGTITFFVLLFALPIYASKNGTANSAKDMFTSTYNQTGWSDQGFVFLLTFLVPCWCISGYDSAGKSYRLISIHSQANTEQGNSALVRGDTKRRLRCSSGYGHLLRLCGGTGLYLQCRPRLCGRGH